VETAHARVHADRARGTHAYSRPGTEHCMGGLTERTERTSDQ